MFPSPPCFFQGLSLHYFVEILVTVKKKKKKRHQFARCTMTLNYADFASHGGSVSKSGGSDVQDVSWWQQPTLYYHTMARQVAVKHLNPSKSRKHCFLKINKSSPWSWKMLMLNFQDTGFKQESLRSYIKKVIYCSMWAIGVGKHCVIFLGGIELEIGDRLGTGLCWKVC